MNTIQKTKHMKADDYLPKNLAALKKYHPDAWNKIKGFNGPAPGEITGSGTGFPNLKLVRPDQEIVFLHNPEDPFLDAKRNLDFVPADSRGSAVFIGMGLGYAPLSFARERTKLSRIIIFEPSIEIFFTALKCNDLTRLFSDKRVLIHIGEIDNFDRILANATSFLQLEDIHFLKQRGSFAWKQELYEPYSNKIYNYLNHLNIDGGTRLKKGKEILDNKLESLSMLPEHMLLEDLWDIFHQRPALLVAGGPSLDKNIEELKSAKDRAIIIAADSTLPALLSHDILPDFITSIDYQDPIYEKIADCARKAAGKISLICLAGITNLVPKIFPFRQVFWAFSCSEEDKWINRLVNGSLSLPGAGSMAHLSLQAAIVMGCDPIVFVGQDLAYSSKGSHANHTVYTSAHNLSQLEQILNKIGEMIVWVKGNNEEKVPTSRTFLNHKRFFEEIIATNPRRYINATEGGAYIQGTTKISLKETIERYCNQILSTESKINSFDIIKISAKINNIIDSITQINSLNSKILGELRTNKDLLENVLPKIKKYSRKSTSPKNFEDLPRNLRKKIKLLNQKSNQIDGEIFLWSLIQNYTLDGLKECNQLQQKIDTISEQQEKYIDALCLKLERLQVVNQTREKALKRFQDHLLNAKKILSQKRALYSANTDHDKAEWLIAAGMNYYQAEELAMARYFLENARGKGNLPPEAIAALGEIYALYGDITKSATFFDVVKEVNPEIYRSVRKRMEKHGTRYLDLARCQSHLKGRFLPKALNLCPESHEIKSEAEKMLLEDLDLIAQKGGPGDNKPEVWIETAIQNWLMFLRNTSQAQKIFDKNLIIKTYTVCCQALLNKGRTDEAIGHLQQAVSELPENAELTSMLAISLINKGDFDQGLAYLDKAVEIDRGCASYWEELGDILFNNGQAQDALIAYEKCFKALPEKDHLIKKIGDCYRESGDLEAALKAYKIYKNRVTLQ